MINSKKFKKKNISNLIKGTQENLLFFKKNIVTTSISYKIITIDLQENHPRTQSQKCRIANEIHVYYQKSDMKISNILQLKLSSKKKKGNNDIDRFHVDNTIANSVNNEEDIRRHTLRIEVAVKGCWMLTSMS